MGDGVFSRLRSLEILLICLSNNVITNITQLTHITHFTQKDKRLNNYGIW